MPPRSIVESLYAGSLLTVTGVLAWISGSAFLFPSLGPSAYLLATTHTEEVGSREVIGGHLVGIAAGLLAYSMLAGGNTIITGAPDFTMTRLQLSASAIASVAITTGGMRVTETGHAPACATTLIVSLGLLSSVREAAIIAVSVVALYITYLGIEELTGLSTEMRWSEA
jgi:hypothetical protein